MEEVGSLPGRAPNMQMIVSRVSVISRVQSA